MHPWEIEQYSLLELTWQLHGARTRHAQTQYGVRQIWVYVHNYLSKNKYRTIEQVNKVWPLYTDKVKPADSPEDMIAIYREMKQRLNDKNKTDGTGSNRN